MDTGGRVRLDVVDTAIALITIDNERKRNAFSGNMARQLRDRFDEAEQAMPIRCVVVTGAGERAFSSGHDIGQMEAAREETADPEVNGGFYRPVSMRKPVIAAVNGAAYAAGLILALSCDIRILAPHAVLCASGARIGLLPIGGQLSRLPHLMAPARAFEMLVTAEPMSATDALAAGFANRIAAPGQVLAESLVMARAICRNPPAIVQLIKEGVRRSLASGVEAAERFEWETAARLLHDNPDAEEGMRAFLEKRPPCFRDLAPGS